MEILADADAVSGRLELPHELPIVVPIERRVAAAAQRVADAKRALDAATKAQDEYEDACEELARLMDELVPKTKKRPSSSGHSTATSIGRHSTTGRKLNQGHYAAKDEPPEAKPPTQRERILALLKDHGSSMGVEDIANRLGMGVGSVAAVVSKLFTNDKIVRVGPGIYKAP